MLLAAMEGQTHRFDVVSDDDAYRVFARDIDTGAALGMEPIACRSAAMAFACAETHAAFERWAAARSIGEPSLEAFVDFTRTRGRAARIADQLGEAEAFRRLPGPVRAGETPTRTLH